LRSGGLESIALRLRGIIVERVSSQLRTHSEAEKTPANDRAVEPLLNGSLDSSPTPARATVPVLTLTLKPLAQLLASSGAEGAQLFQRLRPISSPTNRRCGWWD